MASRNWLYLEFGVNILIISYNGTLLLQHYLTNKKMMMMMMMTTTTTTTTTTMDSAALLIELLIQYDSNHVHPSPPALGQRTPYEGGSRSRRHPRNAPNNKGARPVPCEHPNLMKISPCMIFTYLYSIWRYKISKLTFRGTCAPCLQSWSYLHHIKCTSGKYTGQPATWHLATCPV